MKRVNFILCLIILVLALGFGAVILFGGDTDIVSTSIKSDESSSLQDYSSYEKESISASERQSEQSKQDNLSSPVSSNQRSSSQYVQSQTPQTTLSSQSSSEMSSKTPTYPVNINTATKEELMTIPEIDEEKARVILEFRVKAGGKFSSTEDIKQALWKYDGTAIYHRIKSYIVC